MRKGFVTPGALGSAYQGEFGAASAFPAPSDHQPEP
jgi:hypothetical protein